MVEMAIDTSMTIALEICIGEPLPKAQLDFPVTGTKITRSGG